VTDARSLYAANQARRDALNPIIDRAGGPEAVYQAATNGTKQGATKIGSVMSALAPDQQNLVRATVLSRLGRALPSAQNAEGSAFSASTFLTNWDKIEAAAKDALFGASGTPGQLRANLDSLTRTMSNIRSGTKLQNWAGTGEAIGHSAGAVAAWEGIKSLMAGDPQVLMGTAAGVGANHLLSRALTNPRTVAWLARSTKAPISALPNAVNQLAMQGHDDPDARDLAAYLTPQTEPIARASGGKVDTVDALVEKLMARWKQAKRATDETTKPLLTVPDSAIARALTISQEHI
jgi:hypothetical protein